MNPAASSALSELSADPDLRLSPYGFVFVSRDLSILQTSERARRYIAAEQGLANRFGKLHLHRACALRRLHEAVVGLLEPSAVGRPEIVGVPDREGRVRYAVRVGGASERIGVQSALLVVAELIEGNDVSRRELSSVFGLSERESELAECFARGKRLEQIAPMMQVSLHTARMHLRRVFSKTGCGTQAELARMIALVPTKSCSDNPGAVPLDVMTKPAAAGVDAAE